MTRGTLRAGVRDPFQGAAPEAGPEAIGPWAGPQGDALPPWAAQPLRAEGNGNGAGPRGGGAAAAGQQPSPSYQVHVGNVVWQSLVKLFERQKAQAWRYGGTYGAEFYKEAQYVMVALADEIFLDAKWGWRDVWVSNLLESRIFGTHVAGDLFFRRVERLLADRDPVYRDLGAVYLMALSLGFRGKYRDADDVGLLDEYRRQLFTFVFRREPDLDAAGRPVFPEAYLQAPREETKRRMPSPRAWMVLLAATVLAYVALTHGIWAQLTQPLFDANDKITPPAGARAPGNSLH